MTLAQHELPLHPQLGVTAGAPPVPQRDRAPSLCDQSWPVSTAAVPDGDLAARPSI